MITRQEDRWQMQYLEVREFMRQAQRCPSKYAPEERDMLNWMKYNRRRHARGDLPPERAALFAELLDMAVRLRRVNQYDLPPAPPSATSRQLELPFA